MHDGASVTEIRRREPRQAATRRDPAVPNIPPMTWLTESAPRARARPVRCGREPPFISRLERFGSVESTQPIVRGWLDAGTPEVCLAVADEQTQGRGRLGRTWDAPPGAALLVSAGFRPIDLPAIHAWRLGATVALAMLDAAEDVAGLRDATLGLKWPNDIVADGPDGLLRKVAGVLGEAQLDDDRVATAVVGIGVNADWAGGRLPAGAGRVDGQPAGAVRRPAHRPRGAARGLDRPSRAALRGAPAGAVRRRRLVEPPAHDG